MNVWRRLVTWRLVAMLIVAWTPIAGTALAAGEQIRVKVGPASIYERPRTSADVLMTVPEGTVLDVIKRDADWYWIVLPRDAYGTRRGGYIPAYLVEVVAGQGIVEPGITGRPVARPGQRSPAPATAAFRYLFSLGGGAQSSSRAFGDNVAFPLYDETAQYQALYSTPRASALDASAGVRLAPRFVLGVAYWRSTPLPVAAVGATVPHPFDYDAPRSASTNGMIVGRLENDLHVQLTWLIPAARHVDVSIFGGPSVFFVRQDLVLLTPTSFRETYPWDTVGFTGSFDHVRRSKAGIGANAGLDVTVMVWKYFGVGASARYARGSVDLDGASASQVSMQVGGVQVSGGVRLRF